VNVAERRPRDHREVGAEAAEAPEERVHRRVPRGVRRGVRELVRTRRITARVDVRVLRSEELVHLDRARLRDRDAERLQPVAGGVRDAADRAQQHIERDAHLAAGGLRIQDLLAALEGEPCGLVAEAHVDAVGAEAREDQRRDLGILADHEPRRHLDLSHL